MTNNGSQEYLLLIKAQSAHCDLSAAIDDLSQATSLDNYTLRQRLIGPAINQLHHGSHEALQPFIPVLQQHKIDHWLIQPQPARPPVAINALSISDEFIQFESQQQRFRLKADDQPLIVVADLSGQLASKSLKRLMVHNAHTGNAPADLSPHDVQTEIFRQSPLIDLYWGGTPDKPQYAVRIIPGKFDHRQLGDKAELSRNRNLAALLEIICEHCPQHHIDRGYGLGFLPKYTVKTIDEAVYHHKANLDTLTRYGWLLLAIARSHQHDHQPAGAVIPQLLETTGLAAAFSSLRPDNNTEMVTCRQQSVAPPPSLPSPPPPQNRSGLQLNFSSLRLAVTISAITLAIISEKDPGLPTGLYTYGVSTGLIPLLASSLCLWSALHYWRLKRRMENTPTSKARSAAMGMVEIHGQARRLYALVSPTTQTPCIYYCLKRYRRSGKDGNWRLISTTSSDNVPFIIEDETGQITVDPQGAILKSKISYDNSTAINPGNEKWKEEVIYEGANLYVMGFARTASKEHDTLRQRVAEKLRDLKANRQKLNHYDRNGDGHIDAGEWDNARSDMEQQALHDKLHQQQQRSNQQLVIAAPPQKGLPFIIADTESEAHLTRHYSWYVPPLFLAGVGTFIWALVRAATFFRLF